MAIIWPMKIVKAGDFKNRCLKIMETVSQTKTPVVVTKRNRPLVRVIPYAEPISSDRNLVGSILKESGNPYATGEEWDADLP